MKPRNWEVGETGFVGQRRNAFARIADAVRVMPAFRRLLRPADDEGDGADTIRFERGGEAGKRAPRQLRPGATMKSKCVPNTPASKESESEKRGPLMRTMSGPIWFAMPSSISQAFGSIPK